LSTFFFTEDDHSGLDDSSTSDSESLHVEVNNLTLMLMALYVTMDLELSSVDGQIEDWVLPVVSSDMLYDGSDEASAA
jgi:hypothetical protein